MWELIGSDLFNGPLTIISHRLWVPAGWIVRTVTASGYKANYATMIFVVDHDHSWKLPQQEVAEEGS